MAPGYSKPQVNLTPVKAKLLPAIINDTTLEDTETIKFIHKSFNAYLDNQKQLPNAIIDSNGLTLSKRNKINYYLIRIRIKLRSFRIYL